MGTLGRYLREARESRGIDLHDAAQQTRIGIQYLRALEAEDFTKLPGAVFVRGFLKNYSKFLRLDESEVMKRFSELQQAQSPAPLTAKTPRPEVEAEQAPSEKTPLEPFIWGAVIIMVLVLALFSALPQKMHQEKPHAVSPMATGVSGTAAGLVEATTVSTLRPEKLYLEVVALENTWLLVRIDSSPQKKAVLKKGESLIWSADERFLLSYGGAGALTLLLNGKELTVSEPTNAVIRDMTITASGIQGRSSQPEYSKKPRRKRQPVDAPQPAPQAVGPALSDQPTPQASQQPVQISPQDPQISHEPKQETASPAPAPEPKPDQAPPQQ